MIVKFYNTNSSNNTINKILTDETTYNVKFKSVADFLSPTIELKSETIFNYNYCYIEDFKRYYFVENIEIKPNKIYTIDLNVDVLESFKNDILNCYATVIKSNNGNNYLSRDYVSEVRKECDIYKSNITLDNEESIILISTGV